MGEIVEEEDWNVDEVRGDHESDEHWELRRTFLLKHKGSFDKMKLLCLAQVFVNMEFLGCKYPKETMEKVHELSEGVIEEYRENKKGKLKRTFVKASEAAEKKTKGFKRSSNTHEYPDIANKLIVLDESSSSVSDNKINSNTVCSSGKSSLSATYLVSESAPQSLESKSTNSKLGLLGGMNPAGGEFRFDLSSMNVVNSESISLPVIKNVTHGLPKVDRKYQLHPEIVAKLNGLVLYRVKETDSPITVLQNSTTKWRGISPVYVEDEISTGFFRCSLSIIGETIAVSEGSSRKTVKHDVASKAVKVLGHYFCTVCVKKPFHSVKEYGRKDLDDFGSQSKPLATEVFNSAPLAEENRGIKLLKSMGWNGGGLGKYGEGIEKPIETPSVVEFSRCGVGLSGASNFSGVGFAEKIKRFLEANLWQCYTHDHDLQFSNEFDSNERKIIHQIASNLNLATKSYGKEEERYLVVSQKAQLCQIIDEVLKAGGENEKYKVILPGCGSSISGNSSRDQSSEDES